MYDIRHLMSGRQRRKKEKKRVVGQWAFNHTSFLHSLFLIPHSTPFIHPLISPPPINQLFIHHSFIAAGAAGIPKRKSKSEYVLVLISISFMGFPGNGNGMNEVEWMNKRRMMHWWMGYWCIDVWRIYSPTLSHSLARPLVYRHTHIRRIKSLTFKSI